jgi:hypothetical protein
MNNEMQVTTAMTSPQPHDSIVEKDSKRRQGENRSRLRRRSVLDVDAGPSNSLVAFDLNATIEYHVIPRRQDLTQDTISTIWYKKVDYTEIRDEIEHTVKLMTAGLTDPERVGFCYRGLEYKTPEIRRKRCRNITTSIKVVLKTQNQLLYPRNNFNEYLEEDQDVTELIARRYSAISKQCASDAHCAGVWDARCVILMWRTDKMPTIPRRTWAKAG